MAGGEVFGGDRVHKSLAWAVALLLVLGAVACNFSLGSMGGVGESKVENITVCQYLDSEYKPINPTNAFAATDQPCVSVKVTNLEQGSSIKARWLLEARQVAEATYVSDAGGAGYVGFRLAPGGDLEPGNYMVEIQLNGSPVGVGNFAVGGTTRSTPASQAVATEAPASPESEAEEPEETATEESAAPTATSAAPTATQPSAPSELKIDFESDLTWKRGDEPNGDISRSQDQAKAGSYSGKLAYQFPAVTANYVVFEVRPHIPVADGSTGIVASVYGDGSGHYLNAWVEDSAGEVRQYAFGRIEHQGWKEMTARLDEAAGWPNGHISGPDNAKLDPPLKFHSIVLDGVPDGQASSGAIYLDEIHATSEEAPQPTPTQVEVEEPASTQAAPATLSGRIIFPVYVPGRGNKPYDIYMSNLDGSNRQKIIAEACQPAFMLPDGQRVAVCSQADMNLGLRAYNVGDGQMTGSIAAGLEDARPSWSPDGSRLVFDTIHWNPSKGRQIRIIDAGVGPKDRESAQPPGGMELFGEFPTWLSDGRIVYRQINDPSGKGGLWVINQDGSGKHQLSEGANDGSASGCPSACHVAFMSMQGGDWDVCVVSSAGGGFKNLTESTPGNDGLPAWSPDSKHIAFVTDRNGAWEVWVTSPDGSGQRKLFALESGFASGFGQDTAYFADWTNQRMSWAW